MRLWAQPAAGTQELRRCRLVAAAAAAARGGGGQLGLAGKCRQRIINAASRALGDVAPGLATTGPILGPAGDRGRERLPQGGWHKRGRRHKGADDAGSPPAEAAAQVAGPQAGRPAKAATPRAQAAQAAASPRAGQVAGGASLEPTGGGQARQPSQGARRGRGRRRKDAGSSPLEPAEVLSSQAEVLQHPAVQPAGDSWQPGQQDHRRQSKSVRSQEMRAKMSASRKALLALSGGIPEEVRAKMSASRKAMLERTGGLSKETRARMSAARKAMLERSGGFSEETRRAQAAAATQRQWSLDVRYRMSQSHAGRQCSPEVRQNMATGQQRRRERERLARLHASGGAAAAAPPAAHTQQLNEEMARERAVVELSRLRQVVFGWMNAFEQKHGRKPSMQESAEAEPDVYRAFVRYVGLREMLRGSGGGPFVGPGAPSSAATPAPAGPQAGGGASGPAAGAQQRRQQQQQMLLQRRQQQQQQQQRWPPR